MRITTLIVDDDIRKIDSIRAELVSLGVDEDDIKSAGTAAEARQLLDRFSFELMFLDLVLPARRGSDARADVGMDMLRQIVEDGDLPAPRNIYGITSDQEVLSQQGDEFHRLTKSVLFVDVIDGRWKDQLRHVVDFVGNSIRSARKFDIDVCFITALRHPELEAVLSLYSGWGEEKSLGNGLFYRRAKVMIAGTERSIACAHSNQMGMIASTYATQLFATLLRPRLIVMTGFCGGFGKEPRIGDLIVAEKSWDWQSGKWLADGRFESATDQKDGDGELVGMSRALSDVLPTLHANFAGVKPDRVPVLQVCPMLSGSSVVEDATKQEIFKGQHRKAGSVDMECYGVYYAASMSLEPSPSVICMKGVSDLANEEKHDNYQEFCSYLSANGAKWLIERYFTCYS